MYTVDKIYFDILKQGNCNKICDDYQCNYDYNKHCYILTIWNDNYAIYPQKNKIERLSKKLPEPHPLMNNFIMYYITKFRKNRLSNKWISEKDIAGGTTFFRGPHEIPRNIIRKKYINNLEKFKKKAKLLNGIEIKMADAAYAFYITPTIKIAVLYWLGDREFKAKSTLLFDKSLSKYLSLDIIFCLATDVCNKFI